MENLISTTFYGCTFSAIILTICNMWSILADRQCHKWLCILNIVIALTGYGANTMLNIEDTNWYYNLYSTCKKVSIAIATLNGAILMIAVINGLLQNKRFTRSNNQTGSSSRILKTAKKAMKGVVNFLGKVFKKLANLMKTGWHIFVVLSILNPIGVIGKIVLINKIRKLVKKTGKWTQYV